MSTWKLSAQENPENASEMAAGNSRSKATTETPLFWAKAYTTVAVLCVFSPFGGPLGGWNAIWVLEQFSVSFLTPRCHKKSSRS